MLTEIERASMNMQPLVAISESLVNQWWTIRYKSIK